MTFIVRRDLKIQFWTTEKTNFIMLYTAECRLQRHLYENDTAKRGSDLFQILIGKNF